MKYSKFRLFFELLNKTGLWGLVTYKALPEPLLSLISKFGLNLKHEYISLSVKGYKHPIWLRYQSSDSPVLRQVLIEEEYACLDELADPLLILDCGANVGYSSIYFLDKYPNAHVIAVEPDAENFKICQKNLQAYGDRVSLIHSAIWSHETGLVVCQYGNGHEWETQVKECQADQVPDLQATDIHNLLKTSGFPKIDLLKMDVEGAETIIFSQNYETWIDKVKNIVVELHEAQAETALFTALSDYEYQLSSSGELTVCQNISPKLA